MSGTTEETEDVVDILTEDHQQMLELLRTVRETPDPEQRRDIVDTVIAEVMRHSVAEEMVVYPAVEEHVPDGSQAVEHDKEEHAELVDLMKKLEGVDPSVPSFLELVGRFEHDLAHHAQDEEQDQFPQLRAFIPRDRMIAMGTKVENAKKVAPTRPHPGAPQSELFHRTVGPGVGMVDRLRDALTGRETG